VSVSRTPGHTKYFQTYYLTPTVKLCDCPGLVFPSRVDKQLQVRKQGTSGTPRLLSVFECVNDKQCVKKNLGI
jgi:ribosome biogenesis GTPase A